MRLKELHTVNFKGLPDLSIPLEDYGWSANIYGKNEAGKTSVFDAYTWGLFGMDSLSRPTFGITPTGKEWYTMAGIESTVCLVFEMDDGTEITIERILKEKWRTPRGAVDQVFDGHTTEYWVTQGGDRLNKNEKEFKQFIAELIPPNLFKILSVPRHFNEALEESVMRNMLVMLTGVNESAIQAQIDKVESLKKERSDIASQLKDIKAKIKENKETCPAAVETEDNTDYAEKLEQALKRKVEATTSQEEVTLKNELAEIDARLQLIENQQGEKIRKQIEEAESNKQAAITKIREIEDKASAKRREVSKLTDDRKDLIEKKGNKVAEYRKTEAEVFEGNDVCPLIKDDSGEPFTCSHLAEQTTNAKEAWNLARSKKLTAINEEGLSLKDQIDRLDTKITALVDEVNKINAPLPELEKERDKYADDIKIGNDQLKAIKSLPEYTDTLEEKKPKEQRLSALSQGAGVDTTEIDQEIEAIKNSAKAQEEARSNAKTRTDKLSRIQELQAKQTALGSKHEEKQAELTKAEKIMSDACVSLEDPINSRFQHISYRMTKTLDNGSIVTCCEAMSKTGVPYRDMSNSQKIRAGLEIIKAFSEYYGIHVPVWIDNAESCDHLIDLGDLQVISLIVLQPQLTRIDDGVDPVTQEPLFHHEVVEQPDGLQIMGVN